MIKPFEYNNIVNNTIHVYSLLSIDNRNNLNKKQKQLLFLLILISRDIWLDKL